MEGQIRRAVVQSAGLSLWEELVHDKQGQVRNLIQLEYLMPTAADLPIIETILVQDLGGDGQCHAGGHRNPHLRSANRAGAEQASAERRGRRVAADIRVHGGVARLQNGMAVAVRQENFLTTAFHPELVDDDRFHHLLVSLCEGARAIARRVIPADIWTLCVYLAVGAVRVTGARISRALQARRCGCPHVRAGSDRLSPTECNCSRGWPRAAFEAVLAVTIEVELAQAIGRGDPTCSFVVHPKSDLVQ